MFNTFEIRGFEHQETKSLFRRTGGNIDQEQPEREQRYVK